MSVGEAESRESYCPVVIRHPASSVSRQGRPVLGLDGEGSCHWRSAVNLFKTTKRTSYRDLDQVTLAITDTHTHARTNARTNARTHAHTHTHNEVVNCEYPIHISASGSHVVL